jgi:hypothetical protein
MGETLPGGAVISRFALNAVAAAGPDGSVTFPTIASRAADQNAIWCRCPHSAR